MKIKMTDSHVIKKYGTQYKINALVCKLTRSSALGLLAVYVRVGGGGGGGVAGGGGLRPLKHVPGLTHRSLKACLHVSVRLIGLS